MVGSVIGELFSSPFFSLGFAMELTLYKTESTKNTINKVLEDPLTVSIKLRKGFDIFSPVLMLQMPTGKNLYDYNYMYISGLERYYFIDDVTTVNFKTWRLSCSVDVLETYKAQILAAHARYRRKLKTGDRMQIAPDRLADATITVYESDGGFEAGETIIMTTLGKAGE